MIRSQRQPRSPKASKRLLPETGEAEKCRAGAAKQVGDLEGAGFFKEHG